MKKKYLDWIGQQHDQYQIFRYANHDNKKRYGDIFRIRSLEIFLMLILFLISFLMFHYAYWAIPDGEWKRPILVMSTLIINISLYGIALIGMKRNPYNHPKYLLSMLLFIAIGDILSCFSPFAGGLPYLITQIIWCLLLFKETFIHKYQYIVFLIVYLACILLIILCKQELLISIGLALYILPLCTVCAMSVNSPFFLIAGVFFVLSDCTALLRVSFPMYDSWWVYLITSSLYFFAVLLICLSTFVTKPKGAVTLSEMLNIVKVLQKHRVKFWVAGRWSANLTLGYFLHQFENSYIIYDGLYADAFRVALIELGFLDQDFYSDIPGKMYCDKYGMMMTAMAVLKEDRIWLRIADKPEIEVDNEFFGEKSFGKIIIPCVSLGL